MVIHVSQRSFGGTSYPLPLHVEYELTALGRDAFVPLGALIEGSSTTSNASPPARPGPARPGELSAGTAARPYNLVVQLKAWQAVFKTPTDSGAIVHSLWVSAIYLVVPVAVAAPVFKRRDVAS
jgi:hypothetical protein